MQPRGTVGLGAQQHEGIVINRHVPEERVRKAFHVNEVAKKPAREIDQMHALIDDLSAARQFWIRAPLALVSDASTVPIPAAHEHHVADRAGLEQLVSLPERRMVTMIESDPHLRRMATGHADNLIDLAERPRRGLLDEHVLAGLNGRACNAGKCVIGRGNDDDVDIGSRDRAAPVRKGHGAGIRPGERLGTSDIHISRTDQTGGPQRVRALPADQPASDNRDAATHRSPHVRPRSFGTMRRSV